MSNERILIDFELIWKKINSQLTDDEESLFVKWLEESDLNRTYFENAKSYYLGGGKFKDTDTHNAWELVQRKLVRKGSRYGIIAVMTVAAAILVLIFLVPSLRNTQYSPSLQTELIRHGSSQATLILDDGSVLDLSSVKSQHLSEGGSDININGREVKYLKKSSVFQKTRFNTLRVPRGGEFFLQLADGTKVWLNSETVIHYPVQFSGSERKIELIGEAYFQVARNEKIPFIIESENQRIKVLGTEFNISSYSEESWIYTTLVNGSVDISSRNDPSLHKVLNPGEQSCFNKAENLLYSKKVDPYKYIAWKDGRFVFEDQNLGDIMKTLSKWYDVEVVFTRNDLRNIRFTGNLQRYSDFNDVIGKIEKTNEARFIINNKKIIIEK